MTGGVRARGIAGRVRLLGHDRVFATSRAVVEDAERLQRDAPSWVESFYTDTGARSVAAEDSVARTIRRPRSPIFTRSRSIRPASLPARLSSPAEGLLAVGIVLASRGSRSGVSPSAPFPGAECARIAGPAFATLTQRGYAHAFFDSRSGVTPESAPELVSSPSAILRVRGTPLLAHVRAALRRPPRQTTTGLPALKAHPTFPASPAVRRPHLAVSPRPRCSLIEPLRLQMRDSRGADGAAPR